MKSVCREIMKNSVAMREESGPYLLKRVLICLHYLIFQTYLICETGSHNRCSHGAIR